MADTFDMETPVCDLCGHGERKPLFAARDLRWGGPGEFTLVECTRCDARYLSPRPARAAIAAWYPTEYKAYRRTRAAWLRKLGEFLDDEVWTRYLRLFLKSSYPIFFFPAHERALTLGGDAPRLLDIGCGSGDKLRYVRRHSGWQTFGVDFSERAAANACERGAGDVRFAPADALPFADGFFDGVMSWHSLEHHYSPRATVREAARVLRPGGYGIFAVPSGNSRGLELFRGNWGPLEAPRHLHHFTAETLGRLLREHGLEIERVYFDFSFYGLFFEEEIFESLQNTLRQRLGALSWPLRLLLGLLKRSGFSSASRVPLLPFNALLGRWWRGTNLIVHFRKPAPAA